MKELLNESEIMPYDGNLTMSELESWCKEIFYKSMFNEYKACIKLLKNISKKERESLNYLCDNYEFDLLIELIENYK